VVDLLFSLSLLRFSSPDTFTKDSPKKKVSLSLYDEKKTSQKPFSLSFSLILANS